MHSFRLFLYRLFKSTTTQRRCRHSTDTCQSFTQKRHRQLRVITATTTATLVHAFVTSRLDYCSTLYVGLPAVRLGCLERVIRTAARLIGGIPRTGHVSAYMLDVLHCLPLQQRIMFRIGAIVWRCILGLAPAYLRDLCHPTPGTRGSSSLRS